MKWSITQLRKFQDKPFEFNQTVNFDHLVKSLDLIDLSDIDVEGELTVKSNEVIADMHITGTYTMACARTLVPVEVPIDIKSQEIFDLEGYEYLSDDEENDEHYHDASDGMINLKDIAEELIIVEKPMRAFANDSDQMLREGNGWEVIDEEEAVELAEEETKQIDPRLQKLQQLYDEEQ
ncbi:DNA-binding protein [Staphylococcus nepalensis]|uniref:DNA-binding protein n=1 Tax=Staphylococcus nepalensis TaxID=214473 RepID=A0A2T4S7M5_9STAP|nr:YceD family protein [Staphylococcus nepalensis]PTK57539.1 DNA-binding protein [Staphylococcus nepalensis]